MADVGISKATVRGMWRCMRCENKSVMDAVYGMAQPPSSLNVWRQCAKCDNDVMFWSLLVDSLDHYQDLVKQERLRNIPNVVIVPVEETNDGKAD